MIFLVVNCEGGVIFSFSELVLGEILNTVNQTTQVKDIEKILYHYNNKSLYVLDKSKLIWYNP